MAWFNRLFSTKEDEKKSKAKPDTLVSVDSMPDGTHSVDILGNDANLAGFNSIRHDIADLPVNEAEAIKRYRTLAQSAEVAEAVQEIINETFNVDGADDAIVLEFKDNCELSVSLQNKIKDAFKYVYHDLFDFDGNGKNLFRSWYVDSRLFLHKVIDEKNSTIVKLQQIDPLNMRRFRNVHVTADGFVDLGKEKISYVYVPNSQKRNLWNQANSTYNHWQSQRNAALFTNDSIAYADSGLIASDGDYVIGHLHKAIIPYNNMKMMESAMVIYRVVRAPERRVFYIDVADMPRTRAEKYMTDLINKFKNKMVYDSNTGETVDRRNLSSMLEDIWLPRRSNGRSTEVSTLDGGASVGVTEDVEYCRDVFYRSLNIPRSRFSSEQNPFGTGRLTEITRDECRFLKFIQALRARFILVVEDVLKTELMLRKIISDSDWPEVRRSIAWTYAEDNNFAELKQTEIMESRINTLNSMDNMIGRLFSPEWALRNIMQMNDDEIKAELESIEKSDAPRENPFFPHDGKPYDSEINKDDDNSDSEKDNEDDNETE